MHRLALATTGLVLAASLVACGDEASRAPGGRGWPTGEPLDASGLVWGKGHVIHFDDGTSIDTQHDYRRYAVAGDAVWFTRLVDERTGESGRLWRATRDGVERTEARVTDDFAATSDGRYLVYLDVANGPKDDHGETAYLLVVIDTRTGEETVRTSEGMDGGAGGVEMAYEDGAPWLAAVTDDRAYVELMSEYLAFDLATGEVEDVTEDQVPGARYDEVPAPRPNPSGSWQIEYAERYRPVFVSADGATVTPDAGTRHWSLTRWLDEDSVEGLAYVLPADPAPNQSLTPDLVTVMVCSVPTGDCRRVQGSEERPDDDAPALPQRARPEPAS